MKKLSGLLSVLALSILAFKPPEYKTVSNLSFDDGWVETYRGKRFYRVESSENTSTWSVIAWPYIKNKYSRTCS